MPSGKRSAPKEAQAQKQAPLRPVDQDLFKLQYLNNVMNHILSTDQDLTHTLRIDSQTLRQIVETNPSQHSTTFIEHVKSMKVQSHHDYSKDLQDYGEFINHDIPKSKKQELTAVEEQLKLELELKREVKRLKKIFPEIRAEQGCWLMVKEYQEREKQMIMEQYDEALNGERTKYDAECEKSHLYQEMFPSQYGRQVLKGLRVVEEEVIKSNTRHEDKRKMIAKGHKRDEPYYSANQSRKKREVEISGVAAHCRSRDPLPPPSSASQKMREEEPSKEAQTEKRNQPKQAAVVKIQKTEIVSSVSGQQVTRKRELENLGVNQPPYKKSKGTKHHQTISPGPLKFDPPFHSSSLKKLVNKGTQEPSVQAEKVQEEIPADEDKPQKVAGVMENEVIHNQPEINEEIKEQVEQERKMRHHDSEMQEEKPQENRIQEEDGFFNEFLGQQPEQN